VVERQPSARGTLSAVEFMLRCRMVAQTLVSRSSRRWPSATSSSRCGSPCRRPRGFVQQTMDEMSGLIDNAALDTRVAWVRDLMDRVTVDGREEHAVAVWKATNDEGVNRSDSLTEWLRRAGAGRVLNRLGTPESEIAIPLPRRSCEWLETALIECQRCDQVVERKSPTQRHCASCRAELKRSFSRVSMARRRGNPGGWPTTG